ncbi:MAG TPA: class I SAM-dependent methyltransferase [Nocardioides sp.]|nr:class I SAM-dependent methyltransferase [Nocardioides sp.]
MNAPSISELPQRLRAALVMAGFTYDAVAEVLGPEAHAALARNETTPGLRRTGGGWPLETLIRLFLLQAPVELAAAQRALPGLVDRLAVEGFLEQTVGEVAARLDVRPYATEDQHLWVVSDLTPGLDGGSARVGPQHVLGISSASTSLAQLTLREPVGRALDLGTGCGVQALHLARHCDTVVATDVNERALRIARFNVDLNSVDARVEVRAGSFFEPVAGETYDLIVTNPPFVISPATGEQLVYRDSGLPGDRVVEHIVRNAAEHLTPGGWCQVLANWVVPRGGAWEERVEGWVPEGCDAFVVQRELVDPAAYVELWLKDAGLHGAADYLVRYDTWLSWFEEQGVEAIGFGWINLRRSGGSARELLTWPYDVEQPIAPAISAWAAGADAVVDLDSHLVLRADVVQETSGPPGAGDPETVVLRQQRGLRRARQVDTVEAALAGACDGDLSVGQILEAVAQLLGLDPAQTCTDYLPAARSLVAEGFLEA